MDICSTTPLTSPGLFLFNIINTENSGTGKKKNTILCLCPKSKRTVIKYRPKAFNLHVYYQARQLLILNPDKFVLKPKALGVRDTVALISTDFNDVALLSSTSLPLPHTPYP